MTSALDELTLDVTQSIDIAASIEQVYQDLVHRLSDENATPDNQPMTYCATCRWRSRAATVAAALTR